MPVALFSLLLALLLGKAGFDEMYVLGIGQGLRQPFWAGVAGMAVSLLIAVAGVALWRRWPRARSLALTAAALSAAFHVYGALPPHRNVGIIGAVLGVAAGGVLAAGALRRPRGAGPAAGEPAR